ncbi:MAG: hypothetical protein ACR2OH_06570, partial [Microthrixaceae bacterium]
MSRKTVARNLRSARTPLLIFSAVALIVLGMPSAQASTSGNTDHITVTQELQPLTDDHDCMGKDGMKWSRISLPTTFEIVVTLDRPLCNPYNTAAVIYEMPPTDPRWPQTLAEKVEIVFLEAGVTTIVWDKYCVPAQFDLLEPPTPQTIAPWGPWHGGLVFPATDLAGSNGSAIQYLGGGDHCNPATTTTTSTTSTSTTSTSTTTTEPDDTTTTTEPDSTTSTSTPQVGGSTTSLVENPTASI